MTDETRRWPWVTMGWLSAAFFLAHLPFLGLAELSGDESLYWLYARHPAVGYLTNPPGIGWLVRLGLDLPIGATAGARIGALLVASLGVAGLFALCWELGGRKPAWAGIGLFFCAPLAWLYGFMAAPDVPLIAAAAWMLALAVRGWREERTVPWWLGAGLAAGAGLLAKNTIVLVAGPVLLVRLARGGRRAVRDAAAMVAGALAVAAPHLFWLAGRRFEPLRLRAAVHGAEGAAGLGGGTPGHYLVTQLAVYSPVVATVIVAAFLALGRKKAWTGRPWLAALAAAAAVPFLAFLAWSFRAAVHPYWTAVAWPAAAALGGAHLAGTTARRRRFAVRALAVQTVLVAALAAAVLVGGGHLGGAYLQRRTAWRPGELAALAGRVRTLAPDPDTLFVTGHGYATLAQLAFALDRPEGLVVLAPRRVAIQLVEWERPEWTGRDALVVAPGSLGDLPLAVFFDRCEQPEPFEAAPGRRYVLARCQGYRGRCDWLWGPVRGARARRLVRTFYRAILHRDPGPVGASGGLEALARGELVHLAWNMARSDEYRERIAPLPPEARARRILAAVRGREATTDEVAEATAVMRWSGVHGLLLRHVAADGGPDRTAAGGSG